MIKTVKLLFDKLCDDDSFDLGWWEMFSSRDENDICWPESFSLAGEKEIVFLSWNVDISLDRWRKPGEKVAFFLLLGLPPASGLCITQRWFFQSLFFKFMWKRWKKRKKVLGKNKHLSYRSVVEQEYHSGSMDFARTVDSRSNVFQGTWWNCLLE